MEPSAFIRPDSITTAILPIKPLTITSSTTPKASKAVNTPQRLDYEQIYMGLKVALAEKWGEYNKHLGIYLIGGYSEAEFNLWIGHFLQGDPHASHLHDELLAVFYCNVTRELPDHAIASWVSANDKPTLAPKAVSGDAAEQRLRIEVKKLPPRDRRRLKGIPDPAQVNPHGSQNNILEEYQQAKNIKLPDIAPASAGGLNKTNWDLEIRKRYTQPLASETLEFPDADTILARMTPICYEESLPSGTTAPCAELVALATETFVKDTLSIIFTRTRSNGPAMNGGIMTRKYRMQLQAEEEGWLRGDVEKSSGSGMLPVEVKEAASRRPLGMADLKLAVQIGGGPLLGQMPLVAERIAGAWVEEEADEGEDVDMVDRYDATNPKETEINENMEDNDWGWEGGKESERIQLGRLLDECLSSL